MKSKHKKGLLIVLGLGLVTLGLYWVYKALKG